MLLTMPKAKRRFHRAQKLSFCPDCRKRFANETCILQHMNQPSSGCGLWMNSSLPHFAPAPRKSGICSLATTYHPPNSSYSAFPEAEDAHVSDRFGRDEDIAHDPVDEHQPDTPGPVVDTHPNTPSTYPGGTTFMDRFFQDQYSSFQKENLYYPFASRVDWQLASWLLHSHLSMATIDSFLSLELVWLIFFYSYLKLTHIPDQAATYILSISKGAMAPCRNVTIRSPLEITRPSHPSPYQAQSCPLLSRPHQMSTVSTQSPLACIPHFLCPTESMGIICVDYSYL